LPDFYQFATHPLGKELRRRVRKIICRMAFFRYKTHALYSAQLAILHDLLALEHSLTSCREQASSLRNKASQIALAAKDADGALPDSVKQQVKALQQEADDYAFAVRLLRYGRWLYRYVADGIAWRAYGFNREAIRALGAKEPVAFLSKKEGIEGETNLFKAIRRQGREWLPVMHDLTNCLRTGDFSVIEHGALVQVFELKLRQSTKVDAPRSHSPRNPREGRQAKRLQQVSEFMKSGNLEILHPHLKGGKALKTTTVEKHNFAAVSAAIASARAHSTGYEEPERGLMYLAWDGRTYPVKEVLLQARQHHPHIFDTLFTFRSINPRFEQYHVSLPITAMDLSARDITDILFGRIAVMCILNYECVETFCRNNGVPLRFHHDQPNGFEITVDSKPHPSGVGQGLWDRLLLEALSLQSFADLIRAIMAELGISAA